MRRTLIVGLLVGVLLAGIVGCSPDSPQQSFLVFFQEWSAQLDDQAKGAVSASADWAKKHPNGSVVVIGFADPTGSPQANIDISRTRAQVVTDALVANGVDPSKITRQARGATAFVQNSLESRRVEIDVGMP